MVPVGSTVRGGRAVGHRATLAGQYARMWHCVWLLLAFGMQGHLHAQPPTSYGMATNASNPMLISNRRLGPTDGLDVLVYDNSTLDQAVFAVQVKKSDGLPFPADIEMEIELYVSRYGPPATTVQKITLPQGAIEKSISIPVAGRKFTWAISCSVQGRRLAGLRTDRWQMMPSGNATPQFQSQLLVLDASWWDALGWEGDPAQLESMKQELERGTGWTKPLQELKSFKDASLEPWRKVNRVYITDLDQWVTTPTRIPRRWIDLASYPLVVLSLSSWAMLDDLQQKAMRQWILSGGRCIFLGASDQEMQLLFGIAPPTDPTNKWQSIGIGSVAWLPTVAIPTVPTDSDLSDDTDRTWAEVEAMIDQTNPRLINGRSNSPSILERFEAPIPVDWLIPGVGQIPVLGFAAFIGIFAGLIGPWLAIRTSRTQKPYWLLVVLPLISLLFTAMIVVYALGYEGLSNRIRRASVTFVDAQHGTAFSSACETLFCPLPPRGGIDLPDDAILEYPQDYNTWRGKVIREEGKDQRVVGAIPTRNVVSLFRKQPVEWTGWRNPTSDPKGNMILENPTEDRWENVWVWDDSGKAWHGSIDPKTQGTLSEIGPAAALTQLDQAWTATKSAGQAPVAGPGGMPRIGGAAWLSTRFNHAVDVAWRRGNTPPRSQFVIQSRTASHLPSTIAQKHPEHDFHLVVGRW
jgi:hypothetical protein